MYAEYEDISIEPVVNMWVPNVNVSRFAWLPDTRNYKVVEGKAEQSYENTFRIIFSMPLYTPSHYFSLLIATGKLRVQSC